MKFIVIKTTTVVTTEVYQVDVTEHSTYPTTEDRAITASMQDDSQPVASESVRDLQFKVMKAR